MNECVSEQDSQCVGVQGVTSEGERATYQEWEKKIVRREDHTSVGLN